MKRIIAIDILRGFALLGILLMNIMSFSMPDIAYYNPMAYGGEQWYNHLTFSLVHIFSDQKFMALFSLLFGASVTLLLTKLEEKGQKSARFHYTRNFWLLVIGLIHSVFIWEGDVLTIYALCAFLLYFFRKMAARWQFIIGLMIFLSPALIYLGADDALNTQDATSIAALEATWTPSDAVIQADIAAYGGVGYTTNGQNSPIAQAITPPETEAVSIYYIALLYNFFARAFGMMLIGMAFYTWGIVTAKRSHTFYKRMVVGGLLFGLPLAVLGLIWNYQVSWDVTISSLVGQIPNLLATPFIAGAYVGGIMLWSRSTYWENIQTRLAAVGQMALTNYIGQSIISIFIFYGFGLGLYGWVDRLGQIGIVMIIWAIQLIISPWWMRNFRYGPLEWAWRSLSYGKRQPLRRYPEPARQHQT